MSNINCSKSQRIATFAKNTFKHKYTNDKSYCKVKDYHHYTNKYRDAAYGVCNSKCSIPKEIPVIFCNGSNYDYHFTMEELVKKIEEEFHCLAENTEKYKTVSVPVTNEDNRADKNGKETAKTIFYK